MLPIHQYITKRIAVCPAFDTHTLTNKAVPANTSIATNARKEESPSESGGTAPITTGTIKAAHITVMPLINPPKKAVTVWVINVEKKPHRSTQKKL